MCSRIQNLSIWIVGHAMDSLAYACMIERADAQRGHIGCRIPDW